MEWAIKAAEQERMRGRGSLYGTANTDATCDNFGENDKSGLTAYSPVRWLLYGHVISRPLLFLVLAVEAGWRVLLSLGESVGSCGGLHSEHRQDVRTISLPLFQQSRLSCGVECSIRKVQRRDSNSRKPICFLPRPCWADGSGLASRL